MRLFFTFLLSFFSVYMLLAKLVVIGTLSATYTHAAIIGNLPAATLIINFERNNP